jgi:hypothetical protein
MEILLLRDSEEYQEEIFKADRFYEGFKDIYIKPYCRIQPYIMGIVLGYLLYTHFSKELKLNWVRKTTLVINSDYM